LSQWRVEDYGEVWQFTNSAGNLLFFFFLFLLVCTATTSAITGETIDKRGKRRGREQGERIKTVVSLLLSATSESL